MLLYKVGCYIIVLKVWGVLVCLVVVIGIILVEGFFRFGWEVYYWFWLYIGLVVILVSGK